MVQAAADAGPERIAVTMNGYYGESFERIWEAGTAAGVALLIAAVCNTGIGLERAEEITRHADIAWSCSSRHVRALGERALLQLTLDMPVFAYSRKGLSLLAAFADPGGAAVLDSLPTGNQYLLASRPLPGSCRIRIGPGFLHLGEHALPVAGRREPSPLA
jgi:hypothetical protein